MGARLSGDTGVTWMQVPAASGAPAPPSDDTTPARRSRAGVAADEILVVAIGVVGPAARVLAVDTTPLAIAVAATGVAAALAMGRAGSRWWLRPVIAAAAGVAVATLVGEFVAGWLAAALVVADWAVRRRPPLPFLRPADPVTLPGVVALAALAAWVGRRPEVRWSLVALVGAAVVLVTIGSLTAGRVGAVIAGVGRGAAAAVSRVSFSVLGVPMVVLPWIAQRLVRADPLVAPVGAGSAWVERTRAPVLPTEVWAADAAARRVPLAHRLRGRAASALVTAAVVGVAATPFLADSAPPPAAPGHSNTDPEEIPLALQGTDWYLDYRDDIWWLWREQVAWDPLAPVRIRDVSSRHINVVDGARVTWRPPACECTRLRVWMYGGSTTFGLGQRDGHTIASALARAAWEQGIALDIDNRGVGGDTHWEEAQRFAWDVATLGAPDLVLFLDGINDLQATLQLTTDTRQPKSFVVHDFWTNYLSSELGIGWPDGSVADSTAAKGPAGSRLTPQVPLVNQSAEQWGALAAKRYEWAREISGDVGTANDVAIEWFWQPTLDSRPAVEGELPPSGRDYAIARYRAAAASLGDEVHDISGALDDVAEPLYWDSYHTNERGARLVAEAMLEELRPRLAALGAAVTAGGTA